MTTSSDFVKAKSKSSLLAHLKSIDDVATKRWRRDAIDAFVTHEELIDWAGEGGPSHSDLSDLDADDHIQYLLADGTRELTADWDAGPHEIRAETLESDVATGTAPLTIASTTLVSNLNADLLDGQEGSYYLDSDNFTGTEWTDLTDSGDTTLHDHADCFHNDRVEEFRSLDGVSVTQADLWVIEDDDDSFNKKHATGADINAMIDHGDTQGLADDDHTQYLLADGTRALSGDWSAGSSQNISVGEVDAGDGTNQVALSDVGVYLEGTATMWEDLRVPVLSTKVPGAKAPGFSQFKDNGAGSQGVFLYWFDPSTEEELYFVCQLPHGWKEGSDIECHVHWVSADTAAGAGTDVCWGLEYTWSDIDEVFGNTAIIYGDEQTNGASETLTVDKHYITELGTITGSGHTMSSMLVCRVFRDAAGNGGTDDYDDDAGLMEIDFHYEVNSFGSKEEYVKGP